MAKRALITVTDDLDGTDGAETVHFGYEGRTYEIDLSDENRAEFDEFMTRYVDAARRTGGSSRSSSRRTSSTGLDTNAVRAWATEQGMTVSGRGRLSKKVVEAYQAAH